MNWSSVQFSPAVIYRFRQHQFEGPLSLTPHAGGGLSIVHYTFDASDPLLDPFDVNNTNVGLLFFGGVELSSGTYRPGRQRRADNQHQRRRRYRLDGGRRVRRGGTLVFLVRTQR